MANKSGYGNENAAAGGRSRSTADRDKSYGGGQGSRDSKGGPTTKERNFSALDDLAAGLSAPRAGSIGDPETAAKQNSRGGGGPGPRPVRGPTTGTVVPTKPFKEIFSEPPSITGALKGLADEIIGGSDYSDATGWSSSSQRDLGDPNGTGNTGGRDARQWFDTVSNQQAPNSPAPTGPDAPAMTLDDYLNQIMTNFVTPNARYYLEQRGLVDPTAPAGIPEEWMPAIQRQFDFAKSTLPQDIYTPGAKDADVFSKLRTYFTDQFGNQALSAEEQRRRNQYTTALQGKGFEGQIEGAFGDTADDELINSIINPQYESAQALLGNQQQRGLLTPTGYNYALGELNNLRTQGLNTLQGIGASEREKLGGGVRDYLSSLYKQAGEYTLGGQFDPNAFDTEFGNRLSSSSGSLEGNIRAAAPDNLFDTGTVLQNAGTAQGQSSRGGLLDALANRNRSNSRPRGLGSTGAF